MNEEISIAIKFHELTKHSYLSVRTDRYYLDWSNFPFPFKLYEDIEKIKLPAQFSKPKQDALFSISNKSEEEHELNLEKLAEILFFTGGISRISKIGEDKYYFRVAPATGALYSTELYIVTANLSDLEAGVYHFDPYTFSLDILRKGDYREILSKAAMEERIKKAPLAIILTSLGWRNVWKYRRRSYRHWYWDSGTMTANLLAVANAENLEYKVILGFIDEEVNRLLGIDGKKECALSIISLGAEKYEGNYVQELEEINYRYKPLSKREIEYQEIHEIHRNSSLMSYKELKKWKENCSNPIFFERIKAKDSIRIKEFEDKSDELWRVILKRGSTRKFARKSIAFEVLSKILEKASSNLNADFFSDASESLIDIFLIVNDVEGIESGAYHFDKSTNSLEILKKGKFRNVAEYLCLEQELAGDASVVFFLMTNLKKVLEKYGNRGYRICNYEAGIRAGRIYLASYALNIGATGLTFYDDDIVEFFSPYAKDMQNMMVVAIGIPAYKAKMGKIYAGLLS